MTKRHTFWFKPGTPPMLTPQATRWEHQRGEAGRARRRKYNHTVKYKIAAAKHLATEHGRTARWHVQGMRDFGVPAVDYGIQFEKQHGMCAICGKEPWEDRHSTRLNIDHCHSSDRLRGLLCRACNTGIGQLNDDPELLRKAIVYLETKGVWFKEAYATSGKARHNGPSGPRSQ